MIEKSHAAIKRALADKARAGASRADMLADGELVEAMCWLKEDDLDVYADCCDQYLGIPCAQARFADLVQTTRAADTYGLMVQYSGQQPVYVMAESFLLVAGLEDGSFSTGAAGPIDAFELAEILYAQLPDLAVSLHEALGGFVTGKHLPRAAVMVEGKDATDG